MPSTSTGSQFTLLICTVGGSPEPILKSIEHWRPARVCLLHSLDTRQKADDIVRDSPLLTPGNADYHAVSDPQDLVRCVEEMRRLSAKVEEWCGRGECYAAVVDLTGGTKCMTAALALVARRWPCTFSYIGGDKRSKDGVGVVLSGSEKALETANPLDALGYQAIEDACLLFDRHAFRAARQLLEDARARITLPDVKRGIATLSELCAAYDAWDRFQHEDAAKRLANVEKNFNDLQCASMDDAHAGRLREEIRKHKSHLKSLLDSSPSLALVVDLLANAERRATEGRYDDAVARLYRAIEAVGQLRLRDEHGMDPARVPFRRIPEELRKEWEPYAAIHGEALRLPLQGIYKLLNALGDPLGVRFYQIGLAGKDNSMLSHRNHSILAHGFKPVTQRTQEHMSEAALNLAEVDSSVLPRFPRLGELIGSTR